MSKNLPSYELWEECLKKDTTYQFLFNPWDDAQVQIFEEWETQAALDAHFQTEHMATFRKALPAVVTGSFSLKHYIVDTVTHL